jgi:RimJ/RimL family protein N-acetyltransferase
MPENKANLPKKNFREDAILLGIPILNDASKKIGLLLPVGKWILTELGLIQKIARWRNKFNRMFPSQITVTAESTILHLKSLIDKSDSILFLIEDEDQQIIGHIGAINISTAEFELAHLMRGENTRNTDIIFFAEKAMIGWCISELGVTEVKIEAMSYNLGAISIHEKIGFELVRKIPIRKITYEGGVKHIACTESQTNVKYQIAQYRLDSGKFLHDRPGSDILLPPKDLL